MYRKGVSALIINKDHQFLLVNLTSFEEKYYVIPGGGIEEGENLEEAVYREIEEELGISKENLNFVGKSSLPLQVKFKVTKINRDGKEYDGSERYFFGFSFIGTDSDIHLKKDEVRVYKWVSFAELNNYLLFDNQSEETAEKIMEIFTWLSLDNK